MILSFIIFAAALFIDGATDCANAVTGAVSSRAMTLRSAAVMSAVLTFFGCVVFAFFFPFVAESSAAVFSFPEGGAVAGIVSSLLAVALWSGAAWVLGLPTSEGHALLSASAGAALALGGTVSLPRLAFLILTIIPAALLSALLSVILARIFQKRRGDSFRIPVIISAALSSFFHGAQDGQKFLALILSFSALSTSHKVPAIIASAAFMAFGTLFGGRIIRKMGTEMAVADTRSALASDLGSALAMGILTALGVPASTTHLKMTSLAAATRFLGGQTDRSAFLLVCCAWVATFPVSFALSYFISRGFSAVFL
ncbi:MAG: inorganic phosphate transporter [Ruminococcaceae bacterium]|nr:inorganic phosphate transporter [Oscillospiraceae bacterium]